MVISDLGITDAASVGGVLEEVVGDVVDAVVLPVAQLAGGVCRSLGEGVVLRNDEGSGPRRMLVPMSA